MEYYLAIKINNVPIHAMIWMNLKNIMLSESSQTQKATGGQLKFQDTGEEHKEVSYLKIFFLLKTSFAYGQRE